MSFSTNNTVGVSTEDPSLIPETPTRINVSTVATTQNDESIAPSIQSVDDPINYLPTTQFF